ncbi:hypothetical protein IQ267_08335 [filamentous cyanobacterium LEGE 07170]|nr:hypothetical protein [filamentous cyanobacterium LEGE 07170]
MSAFSCGEGRSPFRLSQKKRLSSGQAKGKSYDHIKGMPFYHLKTVILVMFIGIGMALPQADGSFSVGSSFL